MSNVFIGFWIRDSTGQETNNFRLDIEVVNYIIARKDMTTLIFLVTDEYLKSLKYKSRDEQVVYLHSYINRTILEQDNINILIVMSENLKKLFLSKIEVFSKEENEHDVEGGVGDQVHFKMYLQDVEKLAIMFYICSAEYGKSKKKRTRSCVLNVLSTACRDAYFN